MKKLDDPWITDCLVSPEIVSSVRSPNMNMTTFAAGFRSLASLDCGRVDHRTGHPLNQAESLTDSSTVDQIPKEMYDH